MRASANFLLHRYRDAEDSLWKLFRSPRAKAGDRATAAAGLVGVYEQLGRPVDQLHCALLYELEEEDETVEEMFGWRLPTKGDSLDLPFLLDVGLSVDQLREYLRRYPKPVSGRITTQLAPAANSLHGRGRSLQPGRPVLAPGEL